MIHTHDNYVALFLYPLAPSHHCGMSSATWRKQKRSKSATTVSGRMLQPIFVGEFTDKEIDLGSSSQEKRNVPCETTCRAGAGIADMATCNPPMDGIGQLHNSCAEDLKPSIHPDELLMTDNDKSIAMVSAEDESMLLLQTSEDNDGPSETCLEKSTARFDSSQLKCQEDDGTHCDNCSTDSGSKSITSDEMDVSDTY